MTIDDAAWRRGVLEGLQGPAADASQALVTLALQSDDPAWIESVLLVQCEAGTELRGLVLTCIGHVARRFGAISPELIAVVRHAGQQPELAGRADDAWDDIKQFAPRSIS